MSAERLFKILNRLIDKNTCTAQELAEELEVSIRTIYRDIDTLTLSGIPVITTQGKGGGITLLDNHIINKTFLTSVEQEQIIMALQSIQNTSASSSELVLKLKNLFRKDTTNWIEVDLDDWGMTNNVFEILREAILEKYVVELSYWGLSGKNTIRKVKPARLVFKGKAWYLQGYCLNRKDYRTFKLVRIEKAQITEERFTDILNPPKIISEDDSNYEKVILHFDYQYKMRILEEFMESQIQFLDNWIEVVMEVPIDTWIKGYVLSFGSHVQVIEPTHLRQEVEEEIKKMIENISH
ncbi:helix-turn-helix transcriptional regulator [Anaerorhabdus furcosa]|uniref:Predicted DNA-binding transcriptional regulator YafY, contains an HTH and WYL domains n=1 Tax=Anaerorhabdus furcosa TaxID=118967 RepID=A0A1T4KLM3_9FIRM|nr:YafY family protein [Anaerorhabdus furcosa]SJZ43296.1 Predicted DNA-binding transcriptional regulator YafY, contains an HTH and WYL domains [Anaerorhabdus furcosa]